MRALGQWLVTGVVIYVVVVLAAYFGQRALLYHPSQMTGVPKDVGLPGFTVVTLANALDERLVSWYRPARREQPTYLFLHGNGGSIGLRAGVLKQLAADGAGVFAVGYPGYGASDGQPSEAGLVEAARLAYDELVSRGVAADRIVVFGVSLGSAVAVQLAADSQVGALVLLAPMSSVRELARHHYPLLPVAALLKDRFESARFIKACTGAGAGGARGHRQNRPRAVLEATV